AGVRTLAGYFHGGRERLSIGGTLMVGRLYVDPGSKKEARSRYRAHAGESRYRRRARANGARDVRQDHQGDDRQERALEPDVGDVVPPAVESCRRNERAGIDIVAQSATEIFAAVHS